MYRRLPDGLRLTFSTPSVNAATSVEIKPFVAACPATNTVYKAQNDDGGCADARHGRTYVWRAGWRVSHSGNTPKPDHPRRCSGSKFQTGNRCTEERNRCEQTDKSRDGEERHRQRTRAGTLHGG